MLPLTIAPWNNAGRCRGQQSPQYLVGRTRVLARKPGLRDRILPIDGVSLLDPEILQTSTGYSYAFSGAFDGSSFAATATRVGSSIALAIDGNGTITDVSGSINPGFQ